MLVYLALLSTMCPLGVAAPAGAPFQAFGNFSRRTDLCADAARVSSGEVARDDCLCKVRKHDRKYSKECHKELEPAS
jgi:hypothetical protein